MHKKRYAIYKTKLDERLCTPVQELWPMHMNILKTGDIGDADGEVVNWSQIVEIKLN